MNNYQSWNLANSSGNQLVQVCHDNDSKVKYLVDYIEQGLVNNEAVLIIARPSLRKSVLLKLKDLDFNVNDLHTQGRIKFLDAEFVLASFLIEGTPDVEYFHALVGTPIQYLKNKFGKVRVFGEMVNVLWNNSEFEAAMKLEECWDNLSSQLEFSLLCTYLIENFDSNNAFEESLKKLYDCHKGLIPVQSHVTSEKDIGETIIDVFEATWNQAVSKLMQSKNIEYPHNTENRIYLE